jgi:hypothetical protein
MADSPSIDLDDLERQLHDCIEGGYGNARTPIDWFHVGLPLIRIARQVRLVALTGILNDGDHVNLPTQMWAEDLMASSHVAMPPKGPQTT